MSERERASARNAGLLDTVTYKRDANGEMVQEVHLSDGRTSYVEAEPGREFVEVTDSEHRGVGTFIPIADVNVARAQAEVDSHETLFEARRTERGRSAVGYVTGQEESGVAQLWETRYGDLVNEQNVGQTLHRQYTEMDPKEVRQRMRQLSAYEAKFTEAMSVRIAPPVGSFKIRRVTDEQYLDLEAKYKDAVRRKEAKHSPYQPLSAYIGKIIRTDPLTGAVKKVIRHVIAGEVGMYGDEILILQEGYGSGKVVGVPVEVTHVGQAPIPIVSETNPLPSIPSSKEAVYTTTRKAFDSGQIKLQEPDFDAIFPDDGSGPTSSPREQAEQEGE